MRTKHIFFHPGEKVQLKHDIQNKPEMLVKEVLKARVVKEDDKKTSLLGVTCYWFTVDGLYQQQTFSSKDLEHKE